MTEVRLVTANIAKPILVSPSVSVTLVRPGQPKKVEFPINIILIMMKNGTSTLNYQ